MGNRIVLTGVILFTFTAFSPAEYRSNLYLFEQATQPLKFDFSEITDSTYTHADSIIKTADLLLSYYTQPGILYSPGGIYYYGSIGFYYKYGWWFDKDSIDIYKNRGDSLIWDLNITAPQSGYTDTITFDRDSLPSRLYIVKTSENQHALFILVANYYGGLDRQQFYWALQTDGSGVFQKDTPVKPGSLKSISQRYCKVIQTANNITVYSLFPDTRLLQVSVFDMRGREVVRIDQYDKDHLVINNTKLSKGCFILKVQ
jgi:hypothetical protein